MRAVDGAGNVQAVPATAQAQGTPSCPSAGPGPKAVPLLDRIAPTVTAKLTNARFRLGPARTPIIAAKKRKRAPVGTTFRVTLSEPAAFTIRISRVTPGVKKGKKCVKRPKKTKGKKPKKCTLLTTAGTLTRRVGKQGRNDVKFSGRIGSKALARGRCGRQPIQAKVALLHHREVTTQATNSRAAARAGQ